MENSLLDLLRESSHASMARLMRLWEAAENSKEKSKILVKEINSRSLGERISYYSDLMDERRLAIDDGDVDRATTLRNEIDEFYGGFVLSFDFSITEIFKRYKLANQFVNEEINKGEHSLKMDRYVEEQRAISRLLNKIPLIKIREYGEFLYLEKNKEDCELYHKMIEQSAQSKN